MRIIVFILLCTVPVLAQEIIREENDQIRLVDVHKLDSTIILDLKYATKNNVVGKKIYPVARCLLAKPAADALVKVNKKLRKQGLVIKIFDGYRPHSCQKLLWKVLPDPRYVADPKKGSRHNRGCAVDVTLCELKTKKQLEMPSKFDDFSKKAHRNYEHSSLEAKKNSAYLEKIMEESGFIGLSTEWWHFDYKDWKKYPLLDIPLDKIKIEKPTKISIEEVKSLSLRLSDNKIWHEGKEIDEEGLKKLLGFSYDHIELISDKNTRYRLLVKVKEIISETDIPIHLKVE